MIKKKKLVITGFAAAMAACLTAGVGVMETNAETATTYLAYGAKWNYSVGYTDGFATLGLDDGVSVDGMREGNAPFGFAAYGQYDFTGGTQFSEAQDKQQIYHIYTTEFTVTEAKNALKLQMIYDDGIAVYLDGQEIYRDNIIGYDFTAVTEADTVENSVGVAKETAFYLSMAEGALVAQSEHRITVITAQDFKNGNDAYFNMQISGVDGFTPQDNELPDTISLTYYSDPFTTRGVTYYTGLSLRHTDAKYREVGTTEWTYVPSEGEAWYGRLCHKVAFMDLKENTAYEYALGNELLGVWGKTYTFETAASTAADESFKFSYITDTQSSDAWQFSVWQKLAAYIEANGETFDFFVNGGDIVESSTNEKTLVEEQWRLGFNALESTLTTQTIVPVAGNHEYAAYAFYKHFNINYAGFDECGAYYSFDYGNAHFTVINTNQSYFGKMDEQLAWIENDLQNTNKTWKIALMHFSAVTDTAENTGEFKNVVRPVQEKLMPIFAKYKVDLVLEGHTHKYFRSAIYGYNDNLTGATTEETLLNIRNSVVTNAKTYTDLVDGTIYTVNPNGTTYLTAKSTNYNVYYQNPSWNTNASTAAVFATNPLNGKLMNGGTKDDDTGYLMNYMQYVSVEVGKETLKCNVYNVDAATGETTLWDTYNVLKSDTAALETKIQNLPAIENLTGSDLPTLLQVYGLYNGLGGEGLSADIVSKANGLLAAVSVEDAKSLIALNEQIALLTEESVEEFLACDTAYQAIPDNQKRLVNTENLEGLRPTVTAKVERLANEQAAKTVIDALAEADKIALWKLTQADVDAMEAQYEALTETQKGLVSNAKLVGALKAKLKAAVVVKMISDLQVAPNKAAVDAAYEAYSLLSAEEKNYVENFNVLDTVRKAYALQEEELATQGGQGLGLPVILGIAAGVAVVAAAVVVIIVLKNRGKEE